jgi:protein-disulfide isomerase
MDERPQSPRRLWSVRFAGLFAATQIAMLAAAPQQPAPRLPATDPLRLDRAVEGRQDAPIVLIEFADFMNTACGKFEHEILPALVARYVQPGTMEFAFRNFPDVSHAEAPIAAAAAECAGRQGKFWAMHDKLFRDGGDITDHKIHDHAKDIGLDMNAFTACMTGNVTDIIKKDHQAGVDLGIDGTPEFFVAARQPDGSLKIVRQLDGADTAKHFEDVLDALISKK